MSPVIKWLGGGAALLVLGAILSVSSDAEAMPTERPPRGGGGAGAGGSVGKLQAKLDAAGVQYFGAHELLRIRHRSIAKRVGITSAQFEAGDVILDELVKVAKVADLLRERYGAPVRVLNGYRPRAYNREVNGASGSQHIYGRALDLTADDMPRLRALAIEMWRAGEFGGFGNYTGNVHIDTRSKPASWGSQMPD